MYSTSPATIALTENEGRGMLTAHHRDKRELVRALLRHRTYFALIEEEFTAAKAIWVEEAQEDARAEERSK